MDISVSSKQKFLSVLSNEITILNFENWVYNSKSLENELGEELYLKLVEFNYKQQAPKYELFKLIENIIGKEAFPTYDISKLISRLEKQDDDLPYALMECYRLYDECGLFFLEDLGLAWGLSLACPSQYNIETWDELSLDQKNEMINNLDLVETGEEVRLLKKWITNSKIIITGERDELNYMSFIDKRVPSEKKSRMWVQENSSLLNRLKTFFTKIFKESN